MTTERNIDDVSLIAMTRGGITENIHRGRVSVVSAETGEQVYSRGDADAPAYFRSTAKPIQAIASLADGLAETYGLEQRHLALMAASHRGTDEQMAALEEMLEKTRVGEESLAIHATWPVGRKQRDAWLAGGGKPRKLFHTCAGKHLGVLAWSKKSGWPLEGYIRPGHPAQERLLDRIRQFSGANPEEATVGRDGCGFPVAAVPLWRIALAYGRLAHPSEISDAGAADAAKRITAAMNAFPNNVEAEGRLASILLSDPNVVAKSGAHGVFAIGLKKEKLGIAFAVSDGTEIAWPYVAIALLERFGGVSDATMAKLKKTFPAEIRNDAGEVSGDWEAVFEARRV